MPDVFIPDEFIAALPKLSGSAVKVMTALAGFMDENDECSPTRAEIGKRAGINRLSTISKAIGELKRAGILDVERLAPVVGYRLAKQDNAR